MRWRVRLSKKARGASGSLQKRAVRWRRGGGGVIDLLGGEGGGGAGVGRGGGCRRSDLGLGGRDIPLGRVGGGW